jgi:hypothetical protein
MVIQDKKGNKYTISKEEFERTIERQGNAHKFAVIEDDAPIEVKQLRLKKEEAKQQENKSTKK